MKKATSLIVLLNDRSVPKSTVSDTFIINVKYNIRVMHLDLYRELKCLPYSVHTCSGKLIVVLNAGPVVLTVWTMVVCYRVSMLL